MASDNEPKLINELKLLAIAFVIIAAVMKLAYGNEGFSTVFRTTTALYWLFVIPGYALTLHWKNSLGFLERTIAGTVAAMAIIGVTSYYLGLAGLKLQNQTIVLPAAIIAVSLAIYLKSLEGKKQQPQQAQKLQ